VNAPSGVSFPQGKGAPEAVLTTGTETRKLRKLRTRGPAGLQGGASRQVGQRTSSREKSETRLDNRKPVL